MEPQYGGSFAPPLSDEKIAGYKQLANAAPDQIREAMLALMACVEKWWALPESSGMTMPHASGTGIIVKLDAPIAKELWDRIPWKEELDMYQRLFDGIGQKDLRDAVFHLLWHVKELDLDREPMTTDRLKPKG